MRKFTWIIVFAFLVSGCVISNEANDNDTSVFVSRDEIKETPKSGKLGATDCKEEQRNVDGCIEIYQPVCGQMEVQCVKAPCDLIKQTFENSCKACVNPNVISYTEGECGELDEIRK